MGFWFIKDYIEFFPNPTKERTIIMPLLSSLIMLVIANKRVYFDLYTDPSLPLVSHKFAYLISFLSTIPVIYVCISVCIRSDSSCHSNKIY